MSKGSNRRPENPDKAPGAFGRGFDQMEWPNRPTFFESLKPLDKILEETNRQVDNLPIQELDDDGDGGYFYGRLW